MMGQSSISITPNISYLRPMRRDHQSIYFFFVGIISLHTQEYLSFITFKNIVLYVNVIS